MIGDNPGGYLSSSRFRTWRRFRSNSESNPTNDTVSARSARPDVMSLMAVRHARYDAELTA